MFPARALRTISSYFWSSNSGKNPPVLSGFLADHCTDCFGICFPWGWTCVTPCRYAFVRVWIGSREWRKGCLPVGSTFLVNIRKTSTLHKNRGIKSIMSHTELEKNWTGQLQIIKHFIYGSQYFPRNSCQRLYGIPLLSGITSLLEQWPIRRTVSGPFLAALGECSL